MPNRTAALAEAADTGPQPFGGEIRGLRKAKGLTLAELSVASGVSVSYLSQVERNAAVPSLKSLQQISRALGVTVGFFFPPTGADVPRERGIIVRAQHRRPLALGHGVTDYLLSPNLSGQLELLYCCLAPGATNGEAPYQHEGEEAGVVVAGTLDLVIDGESYRLEAGDSFQFASTRPHGFSNPGTVETVVVWAITPPSY